MHRPSQPQASSWNGRDTIVAATIAMLALSVRAFYLACFRHSIFFDNPTINAALYDSWARSGYPANEPFYQAPLYVYFLKLLYGLGSDTGRFWTVRVAQMLLGAGTAVLAYATARLALLSYGSWPARVGASVAGAGAALAAPLIYFDGEMLPASLATFLLTAAIALLVRAVLWEQATEPPSGWRRLALWIAPGVVFGIAATNRPNVLVHIATLATWLLMRRGRAGGRVARLQPTLAFLLAALLPVLAVTARNLSAGQGFVLLTASYGDNLMLAHNPAADGLNPFPPPDVQSRLDALKYEGLNLMQRTRLAAAEARAYMRTHPGRTLSLWWKKIWLFYNQHEIPNNRSIRNEIEHCAPLRWPPMSWIGAALLVPLAAAGLASAFAARARLPLLLLVLGAPASFALFLICARYRAPYLPLLLILAGIAVARLVSRPPRRELVTVLTAAAAGAFLAWPNWYDVRASEFPNLATNHARLARDLASRERLRGNLAHADTLVAEARGVLERALVDTPRAAQPRTWLGDLLLEAGDRDGAEERYRQALALDSRSVGALAGLARIAQLRDNYAAALGYLQAAIDIQPKFAALYFQRGGVLYEAQQFEAGVKAYAEGIAVAEPGVDTRAARTQVHLGRGMMLGSGGDFTGAEVELRAAVALEPWNSLVSVQLARVLFRLKQPAKALAVIDACLAEPRLRDVERQPLLALRESLARSDTTRTPARHGPR